MPPYGPDKTVDYPAAGEPADRPPGDAAPLTLDEIAQLRALGPTRYRQQVVSLFASGLATEAQWAALRDLLSLTSAAPLRVQRFRDRVARQHEWQAMALLVLAWSESVNGEMVSGIDRAVLARHAAHEQGRDAYGRWQVG